ncbi:MAG: hypothetical protein Q9162_001051 [Coniocarpon cinnabarinum]
MTRSQTEAERLDDQFEVLTENIGYHIHPDVVKRFPPNPTIADVGTGTGLFAIQASQQLPNASFHALDISDKLFPPQSKLPQNVHLGVYNIHDPPPPQYQNKFDLVHVRLIVAGMQPNDWAPAVQHLLQMLKPGGAIEWEECNFVNATYFRGAPGSSTEAAGNFGFAWRDALLEKFKHGWSTLAGIMREAGMTDVFEDVVASDRVPETRRRTTVNGFAIAGTGNRAMADRGIPGFLSHERVDALEKAAYASLEGGVYVRYDIHVHIGFKA